MSHILSFIFLATVSGSNSVSEYKNANLRLLFTYLLFMFSLVLLIVPAVWFHYNKKIFLVMYLNLLIQKFLCSQIIVLQLLSSWYNCGWYSSWQASTCPSICSLSTTNTLSAKNIQNFSAYAPLSVCVRMSVFL